MRYFLSRPCIVKLVFLVHTTQRVVLWLKFAFLHDDAGRILTPWSGRARRASHHGVNFYRLALSVRRARRVESAFTFFLSSRMFIVIFLFISLLSSPALDHWYSRRSRGARLSVSLVTSATAAEAHYRNFLFILIYFNIACYYSAYILL